MGCDSGRGAFGFDFGQRFSEGEGLGLGKDIRHEKVLVAADGIKGFREGDEIAGDEAGALVDELVEAVLAVGAGFAPIHRAGVCINAGAIEFHVFAVALHGELLEVGREPLQVLVVGKNSDGLGAEEVVVPHGEETMEDRDVLFKRRGAEVFVHLVEPREHVAEIVRSESDHVREADRGIHRVASADPVPETEHIGGINAELGDLGGVCRDSDKMFRDGCLVAAEAREGPIASGRSVGHCLEGRECFRRDDEERFSGVEVVGGLGKVCAVDI